MKLTYTKVGDYLFPNLTIKNQKYKRINKYGLLKLHYLKKNSKALYTTLLMKNELTDYLVSVSNECENRLNNLMEQFKKSDKLLSKKSKENRFFPIGKHDISYFKRYKGYWRKK